MAIKLNIWKAMLSGIILCLFFSLFAAPDASAQQRTFFNGGFEQNNPGDSDDDPTIRHICFTPEGSLSAGEAFSVSLRTRIN